MKRAYFGTDGVRGPYGGSLVNERFANRLGVAAARFLKANGWAAKVVMGRDTRASGRSLLEAVSSGFASEGIDVVSLGVAPTPAVAAAVVNEGAGLGVMITASHNPAADNGIKFFSAGGTKLTDEQEFQIESLLPAEPSAQATPPSLADGLEAYRRKAGAVLAPGALQGCKIILDTANGATCETSPVVLRSLGATVLCLGNEPDGANINDGVGSEHPEKMAALVVREGAQVGVAHDGDGDRCVLCDETGSVLDGDEIVTILATSLLARRALVQDTLVVTVQSNLGVDAAVKKAGGRVLRTQVGDRYVLEGMRASGAMLGGESSGHVISADVSPTGDGLVAALKVLRVMKETGKPLSVLRQVLRKFPQATTAVKVREKKELASLPSVPAAIKAAETSLGEDGRVLVRYSGTEPKLRLLVEGPSDAVVDATMKGLLEAVRKDLDCV